MDQFHDENHAWFFGWSCANGKRTSSGFRDVNHRQCAIVLKEQCNISVTGYQVINHLKKWRKIWGRVVNLKNLSGALWDEDTCTIRSGKNTMQVIAW